MKNIVLNQGIKNDKPIPLSYEQLKQRLDAVVAECADMKNAHTAVLEHISVTDKGPAGTAAMIASDALYNTATPNVTAALAEVGAKAIEKFIAKKLKQLEAMHPDTHAFGATAMEIRLQINELQAYVVELREGRV